MLDAVSYMSANAILCNQRNLIAQATQLFNQALQNTTLHRLRGLVGQRTHLLDLKQVTQCTALQASHHAGQREVPITMIQGTEGRCEDFDAAFRPLNERTRERWVRLAAARLEGANFPPVDLIEVGGVYFVRDGHHRISVVRALGQQTIEAEVTVWDLGSTR